MSIKLVSLEAIDDRPERSSVEREPVESLPFVVTDADSAQEYLGILKVDAGVFDAALYQQARAFLDLVS